MISSLVRKSYSSGVRGSGSGRGRVSAGDASCLAGSAFSSTGDASPFTGSAFSPVVSVVLLDDPFTSASPVAGATRRCAVESSTLRLRGREDSRDLPDTSGKGSSAGSTSAPLDGSVVVADPPEPVLPSRQGPQGPHKSSIMIRTARSAKESHIHGFRRFNETPPRSYGAAHAPYPAICPLTAPRIPTAV